MTSRNDSPERVIRDKIADLLAQCEHWSELRRYRKILEAVERALPTTDDLPELRTELLIWKAHAMGAMGMPDRAYAAAAGAWELEPSSQAAHLMALALIQEGEDDHAEEILRFGLQRFPGAAHLVFQLALLMAEQGRVPEAMDLVNDIEIDAGEEDEQVFALHVGIRANLLARMGRWDEAMQTIQGGLEAHPDIFELRRTYDTLKKQHDLHHARDHLATVWQTSLQPLHEASTAGVDASIETLGVSMELPRLVILAAQRLWRRFLDADPVQPRAHEAWAAALLASVFVIDGGSAPLSFFARYAGTSYETVRSAYRRIDTFLGRLHPEERLCAFAVRLNPQLDPSHPGPPGAPAPQAGQLILFPHHGEGKTS
ncbi:MAG: hypothetical protein GXP48_02260 [Acidobacteria bacterium]|nr:hypothetical protein [Acidobacteriota bacterium]